MVQTLPRNQWSNEHHYWVWKQQHDLNLRLRSSLSAAALLLSTFGPFGAAMDFADASIAIKDAAGVLEYTSKGTIEDGALLGPMSKLVYSAPSMKITEQWNGYLGGQAHNICLQSEDLTNASWVKTGVTTPSADTLLASAGSALHIVGQVISGPVQGQTYVASVEMKMGTHRYASLQLSDNVSSGYGSLVDLQTGAILAPISLGSSYPVIGTPTITPVGDGWHRLEITILNNSTSPNLNIAQFIRVDGVSTAWASSWAAAGTETVRFRKNHVRNALAQPDYLKTTDTPKYDLPWVYSGGQRIGIHEAEAAATNIVLGSLMGSAQAYWVGNASTRTLSTEIDPFGKYNAMQVVTTGNAGLNVSQAITLTPGTVYTSSLYLKGPAGQKIFFMADAAFQVEVTFTGQWQRIIKTFTATTATTHFGCERFNRSGGAHLPDVTFHACQGQVELGTIATTPIITYGVVGNRALDNLYLDLALIPAITSEVTMYARMKRTSAAQVTSTAFALNLNGVYSSGPGYLLRCTSDTSVEAGGNSTAISKVVPARGTAFFKLAGGAKVSPGLKAVTADGLAVTESATTDWNATSNRLQIGAISNTAQHPGNNVISQIFITNRYDTILMSNITAA